MVSEEDLERRIQEVRREVLVPEAGIYGPESISWRINRETVLFLGGGAAALLQLAHPFVAYGVDQHSKTRDDPLSRFQRTFDNVLSMVFGTLDEATASARRVYRIHRKVTGTIEETRGNYQSGDPYHANTDEALYWVQATLIDTAVRVYEACVQELSPEEKDEYLRESRKFSALFGIPLELLPKDWDAFQTYMTDMYASADLTVTTPALEMRWFLLQPAGRWLIPLFSWLEVMSAGFMPKRFRKEFHLPYGPREAARFKAHIKTLRRLLKVLPPHLRYSPAYMAALHRLSGKKGKDHVSAFVERMTHRTLGIVSPRQQRGTGTPSSR